ncbi:C-type lectin domain family 4 member D [Amia ocellicauda]|uniref:C-type lectin domain family 4 member D n=1 Tax=Amia ocellicauda TaxID=2972642 RepID=UPI003463C91A
MAAKSSAPLCYADLRTQTVQWGPVPAVTVASAPLEDPSRRQPPRCLSWSLLLLLCVDVCLLLAALGCVAGLLSDGGTLERELAALYVNVSSWSSAVGVGQTLQELQHNWTALQQHISLRTAELSNVSRSPWPDGVPALLNSSSLGQSCRHTPAPTNTTPDNSIGGAGICFVYRLQLFSCPLTWELFEGHCYLVSGEIVPWQNAQDRCVELGSHLVVINSELEQDFVASLKPRTNRWIGLSDRETEGNMIWVDSSPYSHKRSFWYTEQPDDWHSMEDCVHLREDSMWNDITCNCRLYYICEQDMLWPEH